MIEGTLVNQDIIQLSEVKRQDEFLSVNTAEKTLKSRILGDRIAAGLFGVAALSSEFVAITAILQIAGVHSPLLLTLPQNYINGDAAISTASTFIYTGFTAGAMNSIQKNQEKLTKVQNILHTAPIRR